MKTTSYLYTVTNEGRSWFGFPIDMLRYDRCTPFQESDSTEIMLTFQADIRHDRREANKPFRIEVVGTKKPTMLRWLSFGWKVDESTIYPLTF